MKNEDNIILVNEDVGIKINHWHYLIVSRYENKGETYWITKRTHMKLEHLVRDLPEFIIKGSEIKTIEELHSKLKEVTELLATMCKEIEVTHEGTGRGSVKVKRNIIKCGTDEY